MRFAERLRVVDMTTVWVGPAVTRVLADLGADVVKVERADKPEGSRAGFLAGNDPSGEYWNRSPYFTVRAAGKRSIALDLRREDAMRVFHRLLEGADVLVENFTPRVMQGFGLDYGSLRERYPRLVMLSICGYGQTGPKRNHTAVGMALEPAAGVASVTGYEGDAPLKTGNTWVDPCAGIHAVGALLAALWYRERTGEGQHIDVSMQESTLPVMTAHLLDYAMNARVAPRRGNRQPGVVRGTYPCRGEDEWIAITIGTDAEWRAFCGAVGHSEWVEDARFADSFSRARHHDEIDARVGAWTGAQGKYEAMHRLQAAGVPAGALLKADEILRDPQLSAREFFDAVEVVDAGSVPIQRYFPARIDGEGIGARGRAPKLGEHTDEVLREIGLSAREIESLHRGGAIDADTAPLEADAARESRRQPLEDFLAQGSLLRIDPIARR